MKLALLLVFALLLTGCQTSTVITSLEAAVSAAEVAIPVIGQATGLNPTTAAAIIAYLQAVNVATSQAATILAGPETSAQKSAEIVKLFANVSQGCKCVPAGTPQEVVTVVNAVANAVVNFLANLQQPNPPALKVGVSDQAKLNNLRMRSANNIQKLKGVTK